MARDIAVVFLGIPLADMLPEPTGVMLAAIGVQLQSEAQSQSALNRFDEVVPFLTCACRFINHLLN